MRILAFLAACAISVSALADTVRLREDAPDRHVVVKGDTLWGISAKFLKDPWKWPELWGYNKEQIRNPHLIYPGDVLLLSYVDGKPRLGLLETVRLSPRVLAEPLPDPEDRRIPVIPHAVVAPFMKRAQVIETGRLDGLPQVLGGAGTRVMYSANDRVYATAGAAETSAWQLVRVARPLQDPDGGAVLGYELDYLGEAQTLKPGDPQQVLITSAQKEILEGDRLVPIPEPVAMDYLPHAPEREVSGRVVTALDGAQGAALYSTLVLNRGQADGLEPGQVLGVYLPGRDVTDPKCLRARKLAFMAGGFKHKESTCGGERAGVSTLPPERIGLAFVYRVFDRLAFALVLESIEPIFPGMLVRNP